MPPLAHEYLSFLPSLPWMERERERETEDEGKGKRAWDS